MIYYDGFLHDQQGQWSNQSQTIHQISSSLITDNPWQVQGSPLKVDPLWSTGHLNTKVTHPQEGVQLGKVES